MTKGRRRSFSCSFCGKNQEQVHRLMAGPGEVYICSECIDRFVGETGKERGEQAKHCSFCGKTSSQTQSIRQNSGRTGICDECIALIHQIFTEEEHTVRRAAQPDGG